MGINNLNVFSVGDLPFGNTQWVGFEADCRRIFGQVVLIDIDAESHILVLQVSQDLLTCFLEYTDLLERLVNLRLQLLLDAINHFSFLKNPEKEPSFI